MPDMDFSIYSKLAPPAFDPMATVGKVQTLQQGMLNNRLLGQQVQGKIAYGKAAQAAIDPATGKFDPDLLMKGLAETNEGAQLAPEAAAFAQQQRQAQLEQELKGVQITREKLGLSNDQFKNVGDGALGLIQKYSTPGPDGKVPTMTKGDVTSYLGDVLAASGAGNDPNFVTRVTNLVTSLPDDPAELLVKIKQLAIIAEPTAERVNQVSGTPQTLNRGPETIVTRTPTLTGKMDVTAAVPMDRSPSETAGLVDVYDPVTKTMVKRPSGSVVGDRPYPQAQPVQAGPAMGESQQAEENIKQSQALQQRAAIVPQRKAALSNLVGTLGDFTPGPKADLTQFLGGLAQQFGMAKPDSALTKGLAAQEEFNKLSATIALDQWGALGGSGSNDQLSAAIKANPNQAMSKLGIKNVVALLQGNEDAIGAQYDAWKKYAGVHGASSYDTFLQGWNRYYDPRVFQAQHMTPGAVTVMKSQMSKDERAKFDRDQKISEQAGWLK